MNPEPVGRVLHIVGWFPTRDQPNKTLFVKRQIDALAKHCDNEVWHLEVGFGSFRIHPQESSPHSDRSFRVDLPIKSYRICEILATWGLIWLWLTRRKTSDFSLINFHIAYPNLVSRPWQWLIRHTPCLITEHWSAYHYSFNSTSKGLIRTKRIFWDGVPVLSVSAALLRDIENFAGPKMSAESFVVPNVVETSLFFYEEKSLPREGSFLFVGNLTWPKRPDVLIRVIRSLRSAGFDACLSLIGSGPMKEELRTLVAQLDLADYVNFLGSQSPKFVAQEMRKSHALLHCSEYETFSVVCAEALCCGCPVVASEVGGIPEVLLADKTEVSSLIDGFEPDDWAQALSKKWPSLLRDGRANRARTSSTAFSADEVGRRYEQAIRDVLGQKHP